MPPQVDPQVPYNALPKMPPSAAIESVATLKRAIGANRALAALKHSGRLIPNQAILVRAIVLQEAKLSSEIENIVTTNDELYRAFSEDFEQADPTTKEVLRYQEALWSGYERLKVGRPISVNSFVTIARVIKHPEIDVRRLPGTRIVNARTGEAIYTPPEGEKLLRDLLQNLCEYLNAEDGVDPLIKMAVAHYQFEAIHPFVDGNGRAGRVMNILYLIERGLLELPVLYLSKYIIENKSSYYDLLRSVTERGSWEAWILFMLDAVESTARDTQKRVEDIHVAIEEALETARTRMKRGYSRELLDLVFQQPYTRISFLERQGIAKRAAASTYLRELERVGLLRRVKVGRDVLYINHKLLTILTRQ